MKFLIGLIAATFLFQGCMHSPEFRSNAQPVQNEQSDVITAEQLGLGAPSSSNKSGELSVVENYNNKNKVKRDFKDVKLLTKLDNTGHYKDDIFYVGPYGQPYVQKWMDYFTGRGRKNMDVYLDRLPRYEALMKRILKEEGVPEELFYISLIESGFKSSAHSHASAVGYWQFIRGTGKSYGLKQNWLIDERRDPIKSTRAAAQYFKALYKAFGSWHLAMSSYNAGEHRVLRAIMGNVSRDFWKLHEKKQLPKETRNYVPKFIAAATIGSNPKKYGFAHDVGQAPFDFEEVTITKGISLKKLAKNLGVPAKKIKRLNPIFKTDFAPIYRGATGTIRVPKGMGGEKGRLAAAAAVSTKKYIASEGKSFHRVRRGDSLYRIARRYRTSVATLKRLNGLNRRAVIRPGMKIKLPGSRRVASGKKPVKYIKGSTYRVRRGDSLWSIAQKFGISVGTLKRLNKLYSSKLRAGQVLRIKAKSGASASKSKVYYVKRGDNLTKIARKYGVQLAQLIRHNGLRSSSKLSVGKRILIPN